MIARRVLSKYRSMQPKSLPAHVVIAQAAIKTEVTGADKSILSPREQEVLELIARGFSYSEIAAQKGLSVHTVQTHIKSLYGKLEVHSKMEAVLEGTRMGLLRQPPDWVRLLDAEPLVQALASQPPAGGRP